MKKNTIKSTTIKKPVSSKNKEKPGLEDKKDTFVLIKNDKTRIMIMQSITNNEEIVSIKSKDQDLNHRLKK